MSPKLDESFVDAVGIGELRRRDARGLHGVCAASVALAGERGSCDESYEACRSVVISSETREPDFPIEPPLVYRDPRLSTRATGVGPILPSHRLPRASRPPSHGHRRATAVRRIMVGSDRHPVQAD